MSDRPKTIENLRTYLLLRNCNVVLAAQLMDPDALRSLHFLRFTIFKDCNLIWFLPDP
jgi:hypothetical protein